MGKEGRIKERERGKGIKWEVKGGEKERNKGKKEGTEE